MTSKVSPVVNWLHCCELWVQQTIVVAGAHGGEGCSLSGSQEAKIESWKDLDKLDLTKANAQKFVSSYQAPLCTFSTLSNNLVTFWIHQHITTLINAESSWLNRCPTLLRLMFPSAIMYALLKALKGHGYLNHSRKLWGVEEAPSEWSSERMCAVDMVVDMIRLRASTPGEKQSLSQVRLRRMVKPSWGSRWGCWLGRKCSK